MNDRQLRKITEYRAIKRREPASKLGSTIATLLQNDIRRRQAKVGPVVSMWEKIIPKEAAAYCQLLGISGGVLQVAVAGASYLYRMELLKSDLLEQLQRMCPRAKITEIKFLPGDSRRSVKDDRDATTQI